MRKLIDWIELWFGSFTYHFKGFGFPFLVVIVVLSVLIIVQKLTYVG